MIKGTLWWVELFVITSGSLKLSANSKLEDSYCEPTV